MAAGTNFYSYAPNVWGWVDPLGLCGTSIISDELLAAFEEDMKTFGQRNFKPKSFTNNDNNPSGSYTIIFDNGMKYHGKGLLDRLKISAKEKHDDHGVVMVDWDWTPADNYDEAYVQEAIRIRKDKTIDNPNNFNIINSPGESILQKK